MNYYPTVDIEVTSYCNAKCPFCIRTFVNFKPKHMDLEIIKKLPFERIGCVLLIGNKGDAIFYDRLNELLSYIIENFKCEIRIFTNASAHNVDWWKNLWKIIQGRGCIIYALDGLKDTHSLYRIGTKFDKIIENVEAFNKAGGYSICQFIKFKHNEHQIDDIRKLIYKIGSKTLWIKESRAYNDVLKRPEGNATKSELCKQQNDNTPIICKFLEQHSFYISVDGEVRPCCFMGDDDFNSDLFHNLIRDIKYPQHIIAYKRDPKRLNLKYYSVEEILRSDYFKAITKNYKKLTRCNERCKVTFDDIVTSENLDSLGSEI